MQGDLIGGNRIFSGTVYFGGGVSWQVARDLTDSEYSFSGATIDLLFSSLSAPAVLERGLIGAYGGDITVLASPAPEPEAWAMLLAGLSVVPLVARRRKAVSEAAKSAGRPVPTPDQTA